MVKMIGKVSGHQIRITKILNSVVWIAGKIPGKISRVVNKAFGNMVYEKSMSECFDRRYQIWNLKETIQRTEGE